MTHSGPTGVSSFVAVGDVTLHVRRDGAWGGADGAGGPGAHAQEPVGASSADPILYLHALGADLRIFDEVVARLPAHRHLRMDLRGHGLSDAPGGAYTVRQLAADALGVLAAHGLTRAVLVGVSVGGLVALRAALDDPGSVSGLVLAGTAARLSDEDVWRARIEAVEEQGVAALADSTLLRWFPETFREAHGPLVGGYRNMIARTPPAGYAGTCAALAEEDLRDQLAEVDLPTLVLGGSEDLSTPPPVVRELAKSLPRARLEIIDDAGHLPMVDAPERFCALLSSYLDKNYPEEIDGG